MPSEISQRSSRLYEKYSYYLNELNKKDMSDFRSYVDIIMSDVVDDCRGILSQKR